MTTDPSKEEVPIHLDAKSEGDRTVVLVDPDFEDRFVKQCDWVVEASKLGLSRDVWLQELQAMMTHVAKWAEKQPVRTCYAAQRDMRIAVFVVPESGKFDFDLVEGINSLDLELSEKFQACPCDVLQAPDLDLEELANPRSVMRFYDKERKATKAQGQVEAQPGVSGAHT